MGEGFIGLLTILLPAGVWLLKRWAEQRDATAPARREKEIDHAFASDNPADRGAELQSLDDRLRRAEVTTGLARQSPPDR